jgi:hypothetical protein
MKIDESKTDAAQAMCAEDRQNRREFFNGLGKWSMIVVAAVSFLRGSGTRARADHEEASMPEPAPQRPTWTVPDDRSEKPQVAKGSYVKGGGYAKYYIKAYDPHQNKPHVNHNIIQ